jgi:hypothetical protein
MRVVLCLVSAVSKLSHIKSPSAHCRAIVAFVPEQPNVDVPRPRTFITSFTSLLRYQ